MKKKLTDILYRVLNSRYLTGAFELSITATTLIFLFPVVKTKFDISDGNKMPQIQLLNDSIRSNNYIKQYLGYQSKYAYVQYNLNKFENTGTESFLKFYEALKYADVKPVKILHIGDSHVQADIFTGAVREKLHDIFGSGGRGFIVPFSAAKTNTADDYISKHTGIWKYARNIHKEPELTLGLTGVSVSTQDVSASLYFRFFGQTLADSNNLIKVFCQTGPGAFDLVLTANDEQITLHPDEVDTAVGYVIAKLNRPIEKELKLEVIKNKQEQHFFECNGIELLNTKQRGLQYYSVGVNGADFKSLPRQQLFFKQVQHLEPDLIIYDMAVNEFYPKDCRPEFEPNLRKSLEIIYQSMPQTPVLVANTQAAGRRKPVKGCSTASVIMRKVAADYNYAYWDYFSVSGKDLALRKWLRDDLMKSDGVHLSRKGYFHKGELFYNALLSGYLSYLGKHGQDRPSDNLLAMNAKSGQSIPAWAGSDKPEWKRPTKTSATATSGITAEKSESASKTKPEPKEKKPAKPKKIKEKAKRVSTKDSEDAQSESAEFSGIHVVKKGESIYIIARRYKVREKALMQLNNLSNSKIKFGQKLKIPSK